MHSLHPDNSPIATAILRTLAVTDAPLTEEELLQRVSSSLPTKHHGSIGYMLRLLIGANRINVIQFKKDMGYGGVYVVDNLYQLKNPLDGLASL
jgi:hypothetical protein